jgi:hypothetical protein
MKDSRSNAACKAEAEKLRAGKSRVPHYSVFGDDNWEAINTQIEVLESDLDEETIFDRSRADEHDDAEDKWPLHARDSALDARRWMDFEERESPSAGWADLAESIERNRRDHARIARPKNIKSRRAVR